MGLVLGPMMIFLGIYMAGTSGDPLLIFIGIMMAGMGGFLTTAGF